MCEESEKRFAPVHGDDARPGPGMQTAHVFTRFIYVGRNPQKYTGTTVHEREILPIRVTYLNSKPAAAAAAAPNSRARVTSRVRAAFECVYIFFFYFFFDTMG